MDRAWADSIHADKLEMRKAAYKNRATCIFNQRKIQQNINTDAFNDNYAVYDLMIK